MADYTLLRNNFKNALVGHFPHTPTEGQLKLSEELANFIISDDEQSCFVLKGYAGTGKTTFVGALVRTLPAINYKSVLLAPTGRAAKVMAAYAKKPAFTIHKKIYRMQGDGEEGSFFSLSPNLYNNTLFIADEASMIGDSALGGNRSLLQDLFEYVYSGSGCKLLLIGDTAQLPPVGFDESPALNIPYLKTSFHQKVGHLELTEVVRQAAESGILFNATRLREMLQQKIETAHPRFVTNRTDVIALQGTDVQEALYEAYSKYGAEGTMVITRSNKRAYLYNQQIRHRIRWQEDDLCAGDLLMVVKNNYFWLPKESKAGFIANGDIIEIMKIRKRKEIYGLHFADCLVRLADYEDEPELDCMLLLDTISSDAPALSAPQQKAFFDAVMEDYLDIPEKRKRYAEIKNNPYFNALQVKFAYAVTCHKAQGGQWPAVFVEQGYLTDEMQNREWLRWLYTAVTRSTEKLYLVNFKEDFIQ